jgi:hypothetical protein
MIVMAFAIPERTLGIIEHNRRFYGHRHSTHLYAYLIELTAQADYCYHQCPLLFGRGDAVALSDEEVAYQHVKIMHEQVSSSWSAYSTAEWLRRLKGVRA